MKVMIGLLLLCLIAACSSSRGGSNALVSSTADTKLTNAKAQAALNQWINRAGGSMVSIVGIQEIPQENIARADLTVSGISVSDHYGGKINYVGKAIAVFTHYNDGRWVLSKVQLKNFDMDTWSPNITVE
jgi:hypothetical protein